MKYLVNGLVLMAYLFTAAAAGALEWPSLLGDHMVLQQKAQAALWGKAAPGETVSLNASWGAAAAVVAGADGKWHARLQTPAAGGPFSLTISAASGNKTFTDILIGEVWLCSGQSNMEMPLAGWPPGDPIAHSTDEIAAAVHPQIRLFTVEKATSAMPLDDCRGEWQVCTPATASPFSATAYFFGRTLQKELNIPIGLIHSSWGGTPAEAWTNAEYLKTMPEYTRVLSQISESQAAMKARQQWLEGHPVFSVTDKPANERFAGLDFADAVCCTSSLDDARWGRMKLPVSWESTEMGQFDGVVWFRRTVEVPAEWVGRNLVVELGPIDDMDATWFNGERIGSMEEAGLWQTKRVYPVPAAMVKAGSNLIAIRVIDTQGGGGVYGRADQLKLYPEGSPESTLSLAGEWRYLPVAEYQNSRFYQLKVAEADFFARPKVTVEISANTPTFLYNAMIAPLVPYTLRGAIWYQGESNAGRAREYRTLFPLMIDCWRQQWGGKPFPFYYVQIAPYDYGESTRSQELREAQMLTLRHPHTGMAVTLDIGAPSIHPPNKQEVGRRLALWALAKEYGRKLVFSGPVYKKMAVRGDQIILSFDYAGSGLKAGNAGLIGFEIAGADQRFVPAQAHLAGKKVVVSSPQVARPVAVRYAWSNLATASLFNLENLPASSFRTDDWK